MFGLLRAAGTSELTTDEWSEQARQAGLGERRKADLWDFRSALETKKLVRRYGERWNIVL